jgi:hypothetical protein
MFCNEGGFTIQEVEGEVQEDLLDYGDGNSSRLRFKSN